MNKLMEIPIKTSQFYGNSLKDIYRERDKKIEENRKRFKLEEVDIKPERLLATTLDTYKEFHKQNEALTYAAENSIEDDILCCFVGQDGNGYRRFVVTYPEQFWKRSLKIVPEERNFFEVIPENSPCFLYYDLEFAKDMNPESNGVEMTNLLIDITCAYFIKYWKYTCTKSQVINFDSTRKEKFSKHLMFCTDVAFVNNYNIGRLVKTIANDIHNFLNNENPDHDILSNFNKTEIEKLFVNTDKGKKLFMDLSVYSKNRHFRIYKATKWGKYSPLLLAPECEYNYTETCEKLYKVSSNKDLNIFLHSLISYLPRKKKLPLLEFRENVNDSKIHKYSTQIKQSFASKEYPKSPYPALNKYISQFVNPGKVRDSKVLEIQKMIIFEIVGNRYCENIGRPHKSNNIYLVVDIVKKVMYQKCHDEDCSHFVSTAKSLPLDVTFQFEDETDSLIMLVDSV